MLQLVVAVFLGCFLTGASCLVQFINPPPFGRSGDFSDNPIYTTGSTVNVAWTSAEEGKGVSIVLYQLNDTNGKWFGDMEYLTQGTIGVTRYSWLVGTRKNLSLSNMFYLSAYQEGKGVSDSNSHYFYIKDRDTTVVSTSSTSTFPSSTSSAAPNTSSDASLTTNPSANAATSSQLSSLPSTNESASVSSAAAQPSVFANSSDNFPTTAKIGIGLGIPAALAVGIGAGFILFRRRKKKGNVDTMMTPTSRKEYKGPGGDYYNSNMNEAPMNSLAELDPHGKHYAAYHDNQTQRGGSTVRYEM